MTKPNRWRAFLVNFFLCGWLGHDLVYAGPVWRCHRCGCYTERFR